MSQKPLSTLVKLSAFALCALVPVAALNAQTGAATSAPAPLGIFEGQQDVGTVLHPCSADYDRATGTYTLSGSGENMWWALDDFHYVWKKVSGDFSLSADPALLGTGGDAHRKAVLMIRQTLDGNSVTVDLAVHGDGLASALVVRPVS